MDLSGLCNAENAVLGKISGWDTPPGEVNGSFAFDVNG